MFGNGPKLTEKELVNIDKFNSAIKTLCIILSKMDPKNGSIERISTQVRLFIGVSPVDPITLCSPYFRKYRNEIKTRNEKFFFTDGVSHEIANSSREVNDIFDFISTKWLKMSDAEKTIIWGKIDIMDECVGM